MVCFYTAHGWLRGQVATSCVSCWDLLFIVPLNPFVQTLARCLHVAVWSEIILKIMYIPSLPSLPIDGSGTELPRSDLDPWLRFSPWQSRVSGICPQWLPDVPAHFLLIPAFSPLFPVRDTRRKGHRCVQSITSHVAERKTCYRKQWRQRTSAIFIF